MATSLALLFFGTLAVVGVFSMVKIQRQELLDARAAKAKQQTRIEAFRPKCFRPDGD